MKFLSQHERTDTAIEIIFMWSQMRIRVLLGIRLKAIPVSILAKNLDHILSRICILPEG